MRALILIVIACGSIACTTTQLIEPSPEATHTLPAPTDTAPSSPPPIPPEPTLSEVQVIDGIQHTLDLYAQAYNENDPDLFEQVVDQTNFPFRRFVRARFDSFRDSIFGKYTQFSFDVMHVEPRDFGFMQAHITTGTDFATDWLFRQETDGRWVLSEPSVEQIDTPILIESEHFTFRTYAWTSDAVNDQLIEMMEIARQRVLERLGKVPDENILVEINPIYALNPFDAPGAAAIYIAARNQREPDRIRIYAPYSFTYGYYDPLVGWQPDVQSTLTHEFTHATHDLSFDWAGKLMEWSIEGLAEYVSDNPRWAEVCAAVAADQIIPLIDTQTKVYKQDLIHMGLLTKDVSLAYGLAYSLVDYIAQHYDGLDGFWKLTHAYDDMQDLDQALQSAFGVSYEDFNRDWRAWLKDICN